MRKKSHNALTHFLSFWPESIIKYLQKMVCTAQPPTTTKGTLLHKSATKNQTRGETATWARCLKAIAYLYFEPAGFHQYTTPLGSEPPVQPVAALLFPPSHLLDFVVVVDLHLSSISCLSWPFPHTSFPIFKLLSHSLGHLSLWFLWEIQLIWYRKCIKIKEMQSFSCKFTTD